MTASGWRTALVGALAVASLAGCSSTQSAATIDGRAISDEELRFHVDLEAPAVDNRIARGTISAEDADSELGRLAVDAAVHDAVLFSLAHDNGIIAYDDFDGMLDELERENETRADAIAEGEIVYGLTSFTPAEFHSRAVTNMRIGLIEKLGGEEGALAVSDDQVRREYEADPAEWTAGVAQYDVSVVDIPGEALVGTDCASAVNARDSAAAVSLCAGSDSSLSTLDGAQPPPSGSPAAIVLASAQAIEVGATADPIPLGDGVALVHLLERRVDPESALATYRERIRAQLVERALDAEIDERVRQAVVSVDRTRLDSLTSEGSK